MRRQDEGPWIVMRSHDDIGTIGDTLEALELQDVRGRLLALDNASVDGTARLARAWADRFENVAGAYVPGRVLNRGMALTDGPIVVFLNSDCTPADSRWLSRLIAPFEDPAVGAVFGCQLPRPGCPPLEAKDITDTYGDGTQQARWRHCFSMASSAVRRSAWEGCRFDETLAYSEDVDWSWRLRQGGGAIRYAPESRVYHSHGYTLAQVHARQRGEGAAEARIFEWSRWHASLLRYSVLPYARQVVRDFGYCLRRGAIGGAILSPFYRLAQHMGRRAGFQAARRSSRRPS